ncbi:hypothetical protein JCM10449v2_002189 [Rhodotorula kratochvilovae]
MDALDLEIDAYCVVCDRALPAHAVPAGAPSSSSSAAAPPPPPSFPAANPVASTSTAPPAPPSSSSQRSRASDGSAPSAPAAAGAPRLKRTGSSTSNSTAGSGRSGSGAALRRNKSLGKVHARGTSAHGHRSHSHANLAALAPIDAAGGGAAGKGKKALAERRPSKVAKEEVVEIIELDADEDERGAAPQGIYCSDECRRIDEARNALTLAYLGAGPQYSASPFAESALARADSSSSLGSHLPFDAMARRRSSGLSSTSSFTPSRSNLSPIQSAAPSAAVGQFDDGAFPFPPQVSSSSFGGPPASRSAAYSAPAPTASSLPAHPPLLNFAARRRSRGHEVTGGYSYRPSLMERVSSSEGRASPGGGVWLGAERGFSRPASAVEGAAVSGAPRAARSLSTGGGAGGMGARAQSSEALSAMEGYAGRPPSALASLRSMTPLGDAPSLAQPSPLPSSPARAAYRPKMSPRAELPRSLSAQPDLATSPLARHSFLVGSAPGPSASVPRRRGPSFGEPTLPETRPLELPSSRPTSAGLQRRSASSASLALMGTSLGRSYEPRPWAGPKRSESTASLSGLVVHGEMATTSPPPLPPPAVSSSSASTVIPANSSPRHRSPARPPSSPSSASSYAISHSSAFSARSSTAGSSDHPSSSLGSTHAPARGKSQSRGRSAAGLAMTPSGTNLSSGASEAAPVRPPASAVANAASANPALSYLKGDDASRPAPPPPPQHQRSFSWQQIPGVPTYAAYDVDAFRAARASPASSGERGRAGAVAASEKAPAQEEQEGPMLPPPLPRQAKDRKRLFYFSDEHGAE